jgi:hypothetical protein
MDGHDDALGRWPRVSGYFEKGKSLWLVISHLWKWPDSGNGQILEGWNHMDLTRMRLQLQDKL